MSSSEYRTCTSCKSTLVSFATGSSYNTWILIQCCQLFWMNNYIQHLLLNLVFESMCFVLVAQLLRNIIQMQTWKFQVRCWWHHVNNFLTGASGSWHIHSIDTVYGQVAAGLHEYTYRWKNDLSSCSMIQ